MKPFTKDNYISRKELREALEKEIYLRNGYTMCENPEYAKGYNQAIADAQDLLDKYKYKNEIKELIIKNAIRDIQLRILKAGDRKSTRLNSSHIPLSRMPSSA